MSQITNIADLYLTPPVTREAAQPAAVRAASDRLASDTVEFSRTGTSLARAVEESSLRIARTRAIRAEIAEGTFETSERINGTVARLLDVIG